MIQVSEVAKRYKDVTALNGVSFKVSEGEYLALLGPNGAGKTTLMEILEGIRTADSGEVSIAGYTWLNGASGIRKILGLSLQETHFIDKLTVQETLELFASFYSLGKDRIEAILTDVNLHEKKKSRTKDLSGGQKQRLALGLALLNKPKVLFLDEPTTGLDPNARRELWDVLLKIKAEGKMTMILTTHYMEEAEILCDRIIVIDKGAILAEGTKTELLSQLNKGEIISFNLPGFNYALLPKEGLIKSRTGSSGKTELSVDSITGYLPELLKVFENEKVLPEELECRKLTLDDLFVELTGRKLDE